MTVLHTGSTKKYSANWGSIFGGAKPAKSAASDEAKPTKKATTKAKAAKAKPVKKSKPKK